MTPRLRWLIPAVLALATGAPLPCLAEETPALRPAQMRSAAPPSAATAPAAPRLVPVRMHAPPALAAPRDDTSDSDIRDSTAWLRGADVAPGLQPIVAPRASAAPRTGWLTGTDQDRDKDVSTASGRGWLASGVNQLQQRNSALDSGRGDDLDLDLGNLRDDLDLNARDSWSTFRDRRTDGSPWSATSRREWSGGGSAWNAGSSGGLQSPRETLLIPGEDDLARPAYGRSDDRR